MAYYLIIALQVYCVYHLIKNGRNYYWIFLIIFLPVVGCIVYLLTQVYNKRDVEKIQEDLTTIINPTKKIKDLEQTLAFSDTFQNRINLADTFYENRDFQNAVKQYELAMANGYEDDSYILIQLVKSFYFLDDYENVVLHGKKVQNKADFKASKAQFFYGLALDKLGQFEFAEEHLKHIDQRYSNYEERLIFAKLLISKNRNSDALDLLNEIYTESKHMTSANRKKYRSTIREVEQLLKSI
ncbi:hypothetical protein [Psychroserpens sp.]|uniref:hypothetical protein n=1 Tax=Psychroserpens sp. TaxID=2020870 RepID=UPI001B0F8BF4|nr:hypothetical protein [Psychroserpens sp.]MBO6606027.1 hypothetical protein [Psychroserpens sp.]MBO6630333.1 hypothetical protein [Psychroserpens sp.]MBO6652602.1 hypothetical protein [Psychroserpens sp.]MBO6681626.1 hypothetical protein [Psychroserpens sp.]MBO6749401.1 hypothetical protein [Psychroserpens sp.]